MTLMGRGDDFTRWWLGIEAADAALTLADGLTEAQVEQVQTDRASCEALIVSRSADHRAGVLVKARLLRRLRLLEGDDTGAALAAEIIVYLGGQP